MFQYWVRSFSSPEGRTCRKMNLRMLPRSSLRMMAMEGMKELGTFSSGLVSTSALYLSRQSSINSGRLQVMTNQWSLFSLRIAVLISA